MRTGYELGYNVFTITDCCAAMSQEEHESSIATTFKLFSVPMTSAQFKEAFDDTGTPARAPDPGARPPRLALRKRSAVMLMESPGPRKFLPPSSVMHARQRLSYKELALALMVVMLSRTGNTMITLQALAGLVAQSDGGKGGLSHDTAFVRSMYVALVAVFLCDIVLTGVLASLWLFCKARASSEHITGPDAKAGRCCGPWSILRCTPARWIRERAIKVSMCAQNVKVVTAGVDCCKILLCLQVTVVPLIHDRESGFDDTHLVFTIMAGALEVLLISTEASADDVETIERHARV